MTPNTRTLKGQLYCNQRWANPAWPKGSKSRGSSSTFTVEDTALYLGITPSHLYKLVRKYDIPHSRPTNGRIFFSKEELDKWIKSRMVIEPEAAEMPDTPEQLHECYY